RSEGARAVLGSGAPVQTARSTGGAAQGLRASPRSVRQQRREGGNPPQVRRPVVGARRSRRCGPLLRERAFDPTRRGPSAGRAGQGSPRELEVEAADGGARSPRRSVE